jgi:hypothetical protein
MAQADDKLDQVESLDSKILRIQRDAYLNSKGIKPKEAFQLDLLFPEIMSDRNDLRHIPNDYARSSLFTARNKREPRRTLMQEPLFHYNEHIVIKYTGIELRAEDDEIVWLQLLSYGANLPLGEPFSFTINQLVHDIGWSKNGRNYDRVRECISRLRANEVLAYNSKAYGTSSGISLIANYNVTNDDKGKPTHYKATLHPGLIVLFAGKTFTSHHWEQYRDLTPVSRRLVDYIESHQFPYPLSLEKFRLMCGSLNASATSWRQTVKKSCHEIEEAHPGLVVTLNKGQIICSRG